MKDYFPWSYEPKYILVEIEFLVRAAASLVLLEENIIINIIVIIMWGTITTLCQQFLGALLSG